MPENGTDRERRTVLFALPAGKKNRALSLGTRLRLLEPRASTRSSSLPLYGKATRSTAILSPSVMVSSKAAPRIFTWLPARVTL